MFLPKNHYLNKSPQDLRSEKKVLLAGSFSKNSGIDDNQLEICTIF